MKPTCWWVQFDKQGRVVRRLFHYERPEPAPAAIEAEPTPVPRFTRGGVRPAHQGSLL